MQIELGKYNQLEVVKEVDFGVYLNGGEEGEILLPKRYVPEGCKPGDVLNVFIYLDNEERLIATTLQPLVQVGEFACLEVAWVNEFGAFLDWGLMKDLFVPFREQKMKMQKGHRYVIHAHVDEESYRILDQIFVLIKQIKPVSKNGVRELWFRAERGTISDFASFEEYQDMGEVDTYEEFENLWKAFYPDEVTWYRFQAVEDDYNGYRCITLKNKMVIEVDPDGEESHPNDISEFAKWLLSELQRCIAELKAGTYNDYVEKNLPSRHRIGTIRRRDLWDIYPEEREEFFETLSDKDKQDFVQICINQDEDAPVLGRLHNLTANDFYRFCAMGYKAMEYDGTDLSPKEQYYKHADGRDNGLREIDPDSPEAFKEWYHDDERRGGHPWEVCRGGNSTHISLFVVDHDDGYTLVVDGDAWTRTIESVKFFLALYRAGLPVSMRYGDLLAKRLTEDELIGVIPCTVFPAYCGQYFPGQDVIDYMQLPHDNEQEVAAKCVWQELVPTELLPEE